MQEQRPINESEKQTFKINEENILAQAIINLWKSLPQSRKPHSLLKKRYR